jgi:hypothetical protein
MQCIKIFNSLYIIKISTVDTFLGHDLYIEKIVLSNRELFINVYSMLSPDQLRHVAAGRDGRLPDKALGPYTTGAQQPFRLTGTRVGLELGTFVSLS